MCQAKAAQVPPDRAAVGLDPMLRPQFDHQFIKGQVTLFHDELVAELRAQHGVETHRTSVWRHLRGLGLTHKKRPAGGRAEAA